MTFRVVWHQRGLRRILGRSPRGRYSSRRGVYQRGMGPDRLAAPRQRKIVAEARLQGLWRGGWQEEMIYAVDPAV